MIIETRAFGQVEIDDDKVLKFVGPMLGFEGADRYVLMDLNPSSPLKVLQLAGNPEVCFLVTDPTLFYPDYHIDLTPAEVSDLGLEEPGQAAVMVVVTIRDRGTRFTANLLGPIVVNAKTLVGKQVVLSGTGYKVDEPLQIGAALS